MRFIIIAMSVLFAASTYADVTQQVGKVVIQNVATPELYVFCNQKNTTLVLDRVDFDNPGVQAGWASSLPSRLCSVFITDKSPFVFACSQEATGAFNTIDCKDVLLASRLPWSGQMLSNHPASSSDISGSYWVAENISPDEISIMLRHQGFDL